MSGRVDADLIVNCYERTYRHVLAPGFFPALERQNCCSFQSRIVLINNVDNSEEAAAHADQLMALGDIDTWYWVADLVPAALRSAHLPKRVLKRRPYFLDYGLAMGVAGKSRYVLGWDAEVKLDQASNWVDDAIALLDRRPDVFSAACRWPARAYDTLDDETVTTDCLCLWRLNWGFSDQMFLVRRNDLMSPIYRSFAPGAWARNGDHPWTFEGRLEAYQRSSRRWRATLETVRYTHNDDPLRPSNASGAITAKNFYSVEFCGARGASSATSRLHIRDGRAANLDLACLGR